MNLNEARKRITQGCLPLGVFFGCMLVFLGRQEAASPFTRTSVRATQAPQVLVVEGHTQSLLAPGTQSTITKLMPDPRCPEDTIGVTVKPGNYPLQLLRIISEDPLNTGFTVVKKDGTSTHFVNWEVWSPKQNDGPRKDKYILQPGQVFCIPENKSNPEVFAK